MADDDFLLLTPGPVPATDRVRSVMDRPLVSHHSADVEAVADRTVSISGGQAHLGGQVFRVSNMGNLVDEQVLRGVIAVGEAMRGVGVKVDVDAGRNVLDKE